ncbi:MAG: Shedu immune nuclease family protein [Actinomycetota bacterium]
MNIDDHFIWGSEDETTIWAQNRRPDKTYLSTSFPSKELDDLGLPARFVCKVFDPEQETQVVFQGSEWVIRTTPAGRFQIKLLVVKEAGNVKRLWIQRVPGPGANGKVKTLLCLEGEELRRLLALFRHLEHIPAEGERTTRVDDQLLAEILENPPALVALYERNPNAFRSLITLDKHASDVVATAHRREQVARFRELLENRSSFEDEVSRHPKGSTEGVWQTFFEQNPWMLGVSLTGHLLTSWDKSRLEQVVAGYSIRGRGKRSDALMRTSGLIRSMVFAEFKTHRDDILKQEYRPECWRPSNELVSGVAQIQGTVHRAVRDIGERLPDRAPDGSEIPGTSTYLVLPRAFLIIGSLSELRGQAGGDYVEKVRSFELYRRNLITPEVLTFDEVLARAEWVADIDDASN